MSLVRTNAHGLLVEGYTEIGIVHLSWCELPSEDYRVVKDPSHTFDVAGFADGTHRERIPISLGADATDLLKKSREYLRDKSIPKKRMSLFRDLMLNMVRRIVCA